MIIKIKSTDGGKVDFFISFDLYGNLYLDLINDGELVKSFQINIDGKNNPYADQGDYKINKTFRKDNRKFQIIHEKGLLKKKVNEDLEMYDIFDKEEYFEDNWEDEFYVHFPERAEFIDTHVVESDDYIDEDLLNKFGSYNKQFNFSHLSGIDPVPVQNRELGDITSLYDTYVYQNEVLSFRSFSKEEESIYTFKIYDNGLIKFRPNGHKETSFNLLYANNNLLFIRDE